MPLKREYWRLIGIILAVLLIGIGYAYWHSTSEYRFNALLKAALANAAKTTSYVQHVETTAGSDGNTLDITGTYLVDNAHKRYASYSTTTLSRPKSQPVVFFLGDISIGSDVFVKITNKTPKFQLSIPADGVWKRFPANAIPAAYKNIAVVGPTLDGLRIFGNGGGYLSLIQTRQETLKGTVLSRYTFMLSRLAEMARDPFVKDIADHVGRDGTIDVWVDPSNEKVVSMRMTDGLSYTSTTTFSDFNEPLGITAPSVK